MSGRRPVTADVHRGATAKSHSIKKVIPQPPPVPSQFRDKLSSHHKNLAAITGMGAGEEYQQEASPRRSGSVSSSASGRSVDNAGGMPSAGANKNKSRDILAQLGLPCDHNHPDNKALLKAIERRHISAIETREIMDMINEFWGDVYRAMRYHSQRNKEGRIPMKALSYSIIKNLALTFRDAAIVEAILTACRDDGKSGSDGDIYVDAQRFTHLVGKQRPVANWQMRFKAHGTIDSNVQKNTVGVEASANRYMKEYNGPPYAISGDSDHMSHIQRKYIQRRCVTLRNAVAQRCGGETNVPVEKFVKAVVAADNNGTSSNDIRMIVRVLDPKHTGVINLEEFFNRYTFEFLKPKSMRLTVGPESNDGVTNSFQWPLSLDGTEHVPPHAQQSKQVEMASYLRKGGSKGAHKTITVRGCHAATLRKAVGQSQRRMLEDFEGALAQAIPGSSPRMPSASPDGKVRPQTARKPAEPKHVVPASLDSTGHRVPTFLKKQIEESPGWNPSTFMHTPKVPTFFAKNQRKRIKTMIGIDAAVLGNRIHSTTVNSGKVKVPVPPPKESFF